MKPAQLTMNRRRMLLGAGAVSAAGSLMARPEAQLSGNAAAAVGATVVLHDQRVPLDDATQQELRRSGAKLIALGDDPVRLWRGELQQLLARRETRLFGVARWADFLIVRGLAAESRRYLRYERLEPTTGIITFLIA